MRGWAQPFTTPLKPCALFDFCPQENRLTQARIDEALGADSVPSIITIPFIVSCPQENRLTQARIDEALGADLLGRVVFYGQSDITALLEVGGWPGRKVGHWYGTIALLTVQTPPTYGPATVPSSRSWLSLWTYT